MLHPKVHSPILTSLKLGLFLFLSLIVWQSSVQRVQADTWTICKTGGCDFSSIQAAISDSSVMNNDILEFTVNKEAYTERITLTKSLTYIFKAGFVAADDDWMDSDPFKIVNRLVYEF